MLSFQELYQEIMALLKMAYIEELTLGWRNTEISIQEHLPFPIYVKVWNKHYFTNSVDRAALYIFKNVYWSGSAYYKKEDGT